MCTVLVRDLSTILHIQPCHPFPRSVKADDRPIYLWLSYPSKFRPISFYEMGLCKFCRDINLQPVLPPGKYYGKGYKHQPDLVNMIQAAGLGCELCQFFLKCAEGLSQDKFNEVQEGGQLYLCHLREERMVIKTLGQRPTYGSETEDEKVICYFDCVAPDLSRSYPLPIQMMAAKIA
jgi:hypothetical protein